MFEQKIIITDGRMVIPVSLRKQLNMSKNEEATISIEDGDILITTRHQALDRLRKIVAPHLNPNESLVEEFLKEKRLEVKKELDDLDA